MLLGSGTQPELSQSTFANSPSWELVYLNHGMILELWGIFELSPPDQIAESGSPGESHPQAPTERYVTVSCHTAHASRSLETSRSQADALKFRFLPDAWLTITYRELTHPLRSNPITGSSTLLRDDPPLCFASVLSSLRGRHLDFSLNIETTGSHVPHKSLTQIHAISTPEAA